MNLNLSGHHVDITTAIRADVTTKLERLKRHFDHVIDVNVVLSVDKLRQQVTANLHVRGKDIHAECVEPDLYAAIDAREDKLDRQRLKLKEKRNGQRHTAVPVKRVAAAAARRRKPRSK